MSIDILGKTGNDKQVPPVSLRQRDAIVQFVQVPATPLQRCTLHSLKDLRRRHFRTCQRVSAVFFQQTRNLCMLLLGKQALDMAENTWCEIESVRLRLFILVKWNIRICQGDRSGPAPGSTPIPHRG